MPNSRSSTSNKPDALTAIIDKAVSKGDLVTLLHSLLAVCHRDGGQYTELAGLTVSVVDALRIVEALHKDNAALKARLKKLTDG